MKSTTVNSFFISGHIKYDNKGNFNGGHSFLIHDLLKDKPVYNDKPVNVIQVEIVSTPMRDVYLFEIRYEPQ